MDIKVVRKIQRKVKTGKYYYTSHALRELADDGLIGLDARNALLNCYEHESLRGDIRGIRYRCVGDALDGGSIEVICRFDEKGWLRIITVYRKYEE